jgi:hypothetical protein
MITHSRLTGSLILSGIIAALAWRIAVAPAVLGDFDPADMPHRDRAFLAVGNVITAGFFAVAQWFIADEARHRARHLARATVSLGAAAALCAAAGTIGLIFTNAAQGLLVAYVLCTIAAWVCTGLAIWQTRRGAVGVTALLTAALYLVAGLAILGGARIIFLMTVSAAPIAVAMLVRRGGSRPTDVRTRVPEQSLS